MKCFCNLMAYSIFFKKIVIKMTMTKCEKENKLQGLIWFFQRVDVKFEVRKDKKKKH